VLERKIVSDSISYKKIDLFPTSLMMTDWKTEFTISEIQSLIEEIEYVIDHKPEWLEDSDRAVQLQSKSILFDRSKMNNPVWEKIAESFVKSCSCYTNEVQYFVDDKNVTINYIRAWFYKSNKEISLNKKNGWHNHYPAYLSGIFYLQVPESCRTDTGGTTFSDPRGSGMRINRDFTIEPEPLTWIIFPSALEHKAGRSLLDEDRYVIAADAFVYVP